MIWFLLALAYIHGPVPMSHEPYVWTRTDTIFVICLSAFVALSLAGIGWLAWRMSKSSGLFGSTVTMSLPPPYLR